MNKTQYDKLSEANKAIADEAYIDGFTAALEVVKSVKTSIGNEHIDARSQTAVNAISSILMVSLKELQKSANNINPKTN